MPLKTDYKNDVLDTSKNTKRKYQQTTNSDGTISLDDVTVYSQEGSLLGANDVNAITTRVNQMTAQDGLDFRFATDGEGNYGYLKADDSFTPFKSDFNTTFQWFFDGVYSPRFTATTKCKVTITGNVSNRDWTTIFITKNGSDIAGTNPARYATLNINLVYELNEGEYISMRCVNNNGDGSKGNDCNLSRRPNCNLTFVVEAL